MIDEYDKIKFLEYFSGREDYFAVQDLDRYKTVKGILNPYYLDKHIKGFITFGIYVLNSNSRCNFLCIDIDIPKNELNNFNFLNKVQKFRYLKDKLQKTESVLIKKFNLSRKSILFEDTGGRGYHIWLFFQKSINGSEVFKLSFILKEHLDFDFEFFPKQKVLNSKKGLGNLIKLPLGLHQKYNSESRFFKICNDKPVFFHIVEDNFEHLLKIDKISAEIINNIIKRNDYLINTIDTNIEADKLLHIGRTFYKKDLRFLFDNCFALKRIKEKAESGVSLSYSEAFHFTNTLLSVENSEDFIIDTLKKSYKTGFSSNITKKEIENIRPLHPTSCKKLIYHKICNKYCNDELQRSSLDPILKDCNPLSVNLSISEEVYQTNNIDLIEEICNINNLRNTYWKLKKYHKEEDTLFFDNFDFEYFERNLDINLLNVSKLLESNLNYPFLGFLKVRIPKKINDNNKMEYRYLSYGIIYDAILIQSIFNVISPLIESDFQDISYGYRINTDRNNPEEIFSDWRESYPKFRNKILECLRSPNNNYYICCDIEGFYDNICHSILIEKLRPLIKNYKIFNILKRVIESYEYNALGKSGIPQGPAYSRILANLYLNDFDKEILKFSNSYFRYVDDFFIFFNNKKDAQETLKKIIFLLNELGLTLSDSQNKKLKILKTENEEPIIKKIDSLNYGLFEEYKFINYFDPIQIEKFYNAIDNYKMPTECREDILKVNEQLPSILYLISNDEILHHAIKNKLLFLIKYLIKYNCFYPKRLNYIFFKIIDLITEEKESVIDFYNNLDNTHKIYFLLTMFNLYKKDNIFKKEIIDIVSNNLKTNDDFLIGFSISIYSELENNDNYFFKNELLDFIFQEENLFSRLKFLNRINYFDMVDNIKQIIKSNITSKSNYLCRKYLLANSTYKNTRLDDDLYIQHLFEDNGYLLLVEASQLFVTINNHCTLFDAIINLIKEQIDFKEIAMKSLYKMISEKFSNASLIDLNNLEKLYKLIKDSEIKRELSNKIALMKESIPSNNFLENHKLIFSYNQCSYYKHLVNKDYDFIEIIPLNLLKEFSFDNFNEFKKTLEDLSFNKILPTIEVELDTTLKQLSIMYKETKSLEFLKNHNLSLNNRDILYVLELFENLYKKANYYFYKINRIPFINENELFIDKEKKEIFLANISGMLSQFYIIDNNKIRNDLKEGIPLMVSLLLQKLFFKSDEESIQFFYNKPKIGSELFLELFIKRMKGKSPFRYSYERFSQILGKIKGINSNYDYELSKNFFYERLDSLLFKNCEDNINWINICQSIEDLYKEVARIYDKINFSEIKFIYKNNSSFPKRINIHILSNYLLNICKNLKNIFKEDYTNDKYINLFELLNYYSILCIEYISFFKSGLIKISETLKKIEFRNLSKFSIKAIDFTYNYNSFDTSKILELLEIIRRNPEDYEFLNNYSLKQISTAYLINNFKIELDANNHLIIRNSSKLKNEKFYLLMYHSLDLLPKIENEINSLINIIIKYFKTPHDYSITKDKFKIKNKISRSFTDINIIRKKLGLKRFFGYTVDENKFPIAIYCKSFFSFKKRANVNTINSVPLNNLWPSHKSKCSWDTTNKYIFNLIIPNLRIINLINRFVKARRFWHRIIFPQNRLTVYLYILLIIMFTTFGILSSYYKYYLITPFYYLLYSLEFLFFTVAGTLIYSIVQLLIKSLISKIKKL